MQREFGSRHAVAEQSEPLLDQADSRCEGRKKSSGLTVVLKGDRCIEVQRGFDVGVLEQLSVPWSRCKRCSSGCGHADLRGDRRNGHA